MLAIKVVSGPQTGSVIPLQQGTTLFGRGEDCTFRILSPGASKHHAKIEVLSGKVILYDLDSRNGTFVNGVQIRTKTIKLGDKVAFHDVLLEIVDGTTEKAAVYFQQPTHYPAYGNAAYQQQHHYSDQPNYSPQSFDQNHEAHASHKLLDSDEDFVDTPDDNKLNTILKSLNDYIEDVVLPGVYSLPEYLEFKWVLGIFMAAFIVLVTSLSTIPLIRILKSSIEKESQEHALTIARSLVKVNAQYLSQGLSTAVSVAVALRTSGVKDAMIISEIDGSIIAPASRSGKYPDIAFIHEARKKGKENVSQVDSNTVVAMAPIEFYNPQTGSQAVTHYSVVVYDMGSLAVDDGTTLSLFIQTLFIALIIGGILFFFLYKMIEHPLKSINAQLNDALKSGNSQIQVDYDFPVLQALASNITSSLSRSQSLSDAPQNMQSFDQDRSNEIANILELIGFGAMAVNAQDRTISGMNSFFEEKSHLNSQDTLYQSINEISDQALKLSLIDLLDRSESLQDQIATNDLEFNGESFQLAVQAIMGSSGVSYFLIVLIPTDGEYS